MIYPSTLIYPSSLLPKPPCSFKPYGIRIPKLDLQTNVTPKAIVIFVGGFCDTIMRAVFDSFLEFNNPDCIKLYASFNSLELFTSWLPQLTALNLPIFVISHSWGANNFYHALKALNNKQALNNNALELLITLDPVGYKTPNLRPNSIKLWENIYITNKTHYLCRQNIMALIGHSWNACNFADNNLTLSKPNHHASIKEMLEISSFNEKLNKILY